MNSLSGRLLSIACFKSTENKLFYWSYVFLSHNFFFQDIISWSKFLPGLTGWLHFKLLCQSLLHTLFSFVSVMAGQWMGSPNFIFSKCFSSNRRLGSDIEHLVNLIARFYLHRRAECMNYYQFQEATTVTVQNMPLDLAIWYGLGCETGEFPFGTCSE